MAERKLDVGGKCKRTFLKPAATVALIWLNFWISLSDQVASGEPLAQERSQWKASIERPSRGWDYDGKRILGYVGYDICLWDAETGKLLHRMKGHQERIYAVQFSPDGHHALSSSWIGTGPVSIISRDTRTILWNLETGRERDHFASQVAGEFSPDGNRLVTFSQSPNEIKPEWGEGKIPGTGEVWPRGIAGSFDAVVWETYTGRQLVKAKLDEHAGPARDRLHFSSDGRRFVHLASNAVLFNTSDGRELGRISLRFKNCVRYTSSGALASCHSTLTERWFKLTDIESSRDIQSIQHTRKLTDDFAWAHDGSTVAAIPSAEEAIGILDMKSEKMTTGAVTGPYPKRGAIVSPDNRRLAVAWGGGDNVESGFAIYDMNTGEQIARLKNAKVSWMIGFSPDSKTLLFGGWPFAIYNAENGEEICTLNLLEDAGLDEGKGSQE